MHIRSDPDDIRKRVHQSLLSFTALTDLSSNLLDGFHNPDSEPTQPAPQYHCVVTFANTGPFKRASTFVPKLLSTTTMIQIWILVIPPSPHHPHLPGLGIEEQKAKEHKN
jgi:hypothetical protein